jgi:hypothetical protein
MRMLFAVLVLSGFVPDKPKEEVKTECIEGACYQVIVRKAP